MNFWSRVSVGLSLALCWVGAPGQLLSIEDVVAPERSQLVENQRASSDLETTIRWTDDGVIAFYQESTNRLFDLIRVGSEPLLGAVLHPDGDSVIVVDRVGTVSRLDLRTRLVTHRWSVIQDQIVIRSFCLSPSGSKLIIFPSNVDHVKNTAIQFDLLTGERTNYTRAVEAFYPVPLDARRVLGYSGSTFHVLDLETMNTYSIPATRTTDTVGSINQTGTHAVLRMGGTIRIVDLWGLQVGSSIPLTFDPGGRVPIYLNRDANRYHYLLVPGFVEVRKVSDNSLVAEIFTNGLDSLNNWVDGDLQTPPDRYDTITGSPLGGNPDFRPNIFDLGRHPVSVITHDDGRFFGVSGSHGSERVLRTSTGWRNQGGTSGFQDWPAKGGPGSAALSVEGGKIGIRPEPDKLVAESSLLSSYKFTAAHYHQSLNRLYFVDEEGFIGVAFFNNGAITTGLNWLLFPEGRPTSVHAPVAGVVVVGTSAGEVFFLNALTFAVLARQEGHQDAVTSISSGADPDTVVTGGADGSLIRWSLATRSPVATGQIPRGGVRRIFFLPGGRLLVGTNGSSLYTVRADTLALDQDWSGILDSFRPNGLGYNELNQEIGIARGRRHLSRYPLSSGAQNWQLMLRADDHVTGQAMTDFEVLALRQSRSGNSVPIGSQTRTGVYLDLRFQATNEPVRALVSALGYLKKVVPMDQAINGVLSARATLRGGDVDGDNEVTIFDYIELSAGFMSVPPDSAFNPAADFDRDQYITIFDYIILSQNFGLEGDSF